MVVNSPSPFAVPTLWGPWCRDVPRNRGGHQGNGRRFTHVLVEAVFRVPRPRGRRLFVARLGKTTGGISDPLEVNVND